MIRNGGQSNAKEIHSAPVYQQQSRLVEVKKKTTQPSFQVSRSRDFFRQPFYDSHITAVV